MMKYQVDVLVMLLFLCRCLRVVTTSDGNEFFQRSGSGKESESDVMLPPRSMMSMGLHRARGTATDDRQQRRLRGRQLLANESETTPLYQGLGTHYSYIYVGTPPQRVSVIIDTGSHHTAFPCVGCQCGKHMDPLFDPKKSNTSEILQCSGKKRCYFSQAYSEGSSWHAYRVKDKLWAGGSLDTSINTAVDWSIDFNFGCEDSETGLFRTQHVDGIMGMSAAEDTLPHQLMAKKVTDTRVFGLCFGVGGGIMTLGGVDASLHQSGEEVQYAKLLKGKGWFTVNLLDVSIRPADSTRSKQSIGASLETLNGQNNKGVIVDSGTTDTYLPRAVAKSFEDIFKKLSNGVAYDNNSKSLKQSQVDSLPVIVFKLEGADGDPIEVECPPSSYMETLGGGKYAFRIYLTESSGAVLGANFMNDQNVIFDIDQKRVGFAKANCKYDENDKKKREAEELLKSSNTASRTLVSDSLSTSSSTSGTSNSSRTRGVASISVSSTNDVAISSIYSGTVSGATNSNGDNPATY